MLRPDKLSREFTWAALFVVYLLCVVATAAWSLHRYHQLRSAWAWDLAHLNQSFWALTHGGDRITIRPRNHYAQERPEPWRSVHLDPLKLLLLPAYLVWPAPQTLLVGHCALFWLSLVPVFQLASAAPRGSPHPRPAVGLLAALLWALTPWPTALALNDCRTLQMGLPFFLWAVWGYTERRWKVFLAGALLALAARQEFSLALALITILPQKARLTPSESQQSPPGRLPKSTPPPERTGTPHSTLNSRLPSFAWPAAAIAIGLLGFVAYLVY